jgi:hypothetical protein
MLLKLLSDLPIDVEKVLDDLIIGTSSGVSSSRGVVKNRSSVFICFVNAHLLGVNDVLDVRKVCRAEVIVACFLKEFMMVLEHFNCVVEVVVHS